MKYRGRSAFITGASSGLGEAFARALAQRGMAVLLTALPEDQSRLRTLAAELTARHPIRAEIVAVDLAERDAARRLQAAADELDFEPDLLVNSAGLGAVGSFFQVPLERQLDIIRINVEALVALTGLYLPRMVDRHDGAVLNVASTAAFEPIPYLAVYAASKAFVVNFSEALWAEHHRHGVRVVALCPGPLADTGFRERAGGAPPTGIRRHAPQIAREAVVASALRALEQDRPTVVRRVPGLAVAYYVATLAGTFTPRRLRLLVTERLYRWYFQQG